MKNNICPCEKHQTLLAILVLDRENAQREKRWLHRLRSRERKNNWTILQQRVKLVHSGRLLFCQWVHNQMFSGIYPSGVGIVKHSTLFCGLHSQRAADAENASKYGYKNNSAKVANIKIKAG